MSNVNLTIGGRHFTVACAEGEEAHIAMLGQLIDAKINALGDSAGQNEVRMLLYAALVLADELHEATSASAPEPEAATPVAPPGLAAKLDRMAERLENLAISLEHQAPST